MTGKADVLTCLALRANLIGGTGMGEGRSVAALASHRLQTLREIEESLPLLRAFLARQTAGRHMTGEAVEIEVLFLPDQGLIRPGMGRALPESSLGLMTLGADS